MNQPVPECLSCGACCFGGHDRYIALFPEDHHRGLPETAIWRDGERAFMRMQDGHCAQLQPQPGGAMACAVYDRRPTACRAFRAGSFECRQSLRHRMHQADAIRLPEMPVEIAALAIGLEGAG